MGSQDELVDLALASIRLAYDSHPRRVRPVALVRSAEVEQHKVAGSEPASGGPAVGQSRDWAREQQGVESERAAGGDDRCHERVGGVVLGLTHAVRLTVFVGR